jgi:hypothetical protein
MVDKNKEKMIMKNIMKHKFLLLISVEILEMILILLSLQIPNYVQIVKPDGNLILIMALALLPRIGNALFVCLVCFKQYLRSLKIHIFNFFLLSFIIIVVIIGIDKLFPSLSEFIFTPSHRYFNLLISFTVYLVYFVFIIVKINKAKIDPHGFMYFLINSFFVYIFLPVFSKIIMIARAVAEGQNALL